MLALHCIFVLTRRIGGFAGTPPLEGLRVVVSEASTVDDPEAEEKVIELDDVSRAFFEAPATREIVEALRPVPPIRET